MSTTVARTQDQTFPFQLSDAEWRERLTPVQYEILRGHGTERSCTSPLLEEHRAGVYHCAGCDAPLFSTDAKFESGTGWPSFFQPLTVDAIGTHTDRSWGMTRTECHCSNCGGHMGHVFPDGPRPTGLRYCINGVSLDFKPDEG